MNEIVPKKLVTVWDILLLLATAASLLFFDIPIAEFFHHSPLIEEEFFKSFTDFGSVLHVPAILAAIVYFGYIKKDQTWFRRWIFVFIALAVVCLMTHSLKFVLGRYRPVLYFREGLVAFHPFGMIWSGKANSFPSGHTSNIMATAMAVSILFPRLRGFFYSLGLLISFSRVALTQHYCADVLCGIYIASLGIRLTYNFLIKRGWAIDRAPDGSS